MPKKEKQNDNVDCPSKKDKLPGKYRYGKEIKEEAGRLEKTVKTGDKMVGIYKGCLRGFTVVQCHTNNKGEDGVIIKLDSGLDGDETLLELQWNYNRNPAVGVWEHRSKQPEITNIRVGSVFGR